MVDVPAALPDLDRLDSTALKELVVGLHAHIEHLKLVIAKLRRSQFGRKSEKIARQIEQLQLQLEGLEAIRVEPVRQPVSQPSSKPAPSAATKQRTLPGHLRREVHTHLPEHKDCPECGGSLRKMGEDISEMLECVPASFLVIRHVRPKLSCARCACILQAPAPTRPVDRGMAGPGLLAHVLTAKFSDHLPLYRQSQIYAREGVDLDRSTLARWAGEASHLLAPLVEVLRRYVMKTDKLHGDDTPLPVLAPGSGKTKTGASGPMCATAARAAMTHLRRCGSPIRPIAEANIRSGIWPTSTASCRPMLTPDLTSSTKAARSRKRPAWRTSGASSMT
jgi:transposase